MIDVATEGRQSAIREALELPPDRLSRRLDPATLPFETTAEVEPLVGTVGQPRAVAALEFGLRASSHGFNVFVAGTPGSGRFTTAFDHVQQIAAALPAPDDWVYVHNFAAPDRPRALRLPAGRGTGLAEDMGEFVRAARREIARAFESEEYARRHHELVAAVNERRGALVQNLVDYARAREYAITVTAAGVVSSPLVEGKQITRDEFDALPEARRSEIERHGEEITERTSAYVRQVHELEKEAAERLRALDRDVALFATGPLLRDLHERYTDLADVVEHLEAVEADVVAHLDDFREGDETAGVLPFPLGAARAPDLSRYDVNVVVDNAAVEGAPVVVERNPTYYNLAGRVEYRASFGTMVTDFREIKGGALHR
ncbi:MAG: Lon-like protease helical domain-containing protein, partial [Pseudomonadota bacterium]